MSKQYTVVVSLEGANTENNIEIDLEASNEQEARDMAMEAIETIKVAYVVEYPLL